MLVTKLTRRLGRKYIPPGGDRYQPWTLETELEVTLEPGDCIKTAQEKMREFILKDIELQKEDCK